MRIAALDIGGTSIKSGIWDGKQTLELKEWDTNASRGGACLMARAVAILHTYGDFDAIGISTAGQVDSEQGSIYYANDNIPGYTGTKIRDILEAEFGVPVAVENDVNAAALGELYFGAAKGAEQSLSTVRFIPAVPGPAEALAESSPIRRPWKRGWNSADVTKNTRPRPDLYGRR